MKTSRRTANESSWAFSGVFFIFSSISPWSIRYLFFSFPVGEWWDGGRERGGGRHRGSERCSKGGNGKRAEEEKDKRVMASVFPLCTKKFRRV